MKLFDWGHANKKSKNNVIPKDNIFHIMDNKRVNYDVVPMDVVNVLMFSVVIISDATN